MAAAPLNVAAGATVSAGCELADMVCPDSVRGAFAKAAGGVSFVPRNAARVVRAPLTGAIVGSASVLRAGGSTVERCTRLRSALVTTCSKGAAVITMARRHATKAE